MLGNREQRVGMRNGIVLTATMAVLVTACSSETPTGAVDRALDDSVLQTAPDRAPAAQTDDGQAQTAPGPEGNTGAAPTTAGPTGQTETGPSQPAPPPSNQNPDTTPPPPTNAPPPGPDNREMGAGVDAETILIGFHNQEVAGAAASLGANVSSADEGAIGDALVAWVNANGGIAGRQVVAVHHIAESTSGTWASQAQAACATFTEDNQVFAVVGSTVGGDDSLLQCLAQRSTPLFDSGVFPYDQAAYKEFKGVLYKPGSMVAERWGREYVDGLHRLGYFEGGKVGLLTYDRPLLTRLSDNVVKPRLTHHGIEFIESIVTPPGSVAGMGATGSQMSSAIVRFRAEGVNRVMFLENGGTAPFLFFNEAESQGYRPIYGITSNDVPLTQAGNAGPEQLTGAVGIGWNPGNDSVDGTPENGARTLCSQIMDDAGISTAQYYTHPRCDAIFLLREAMAAAPSLDAAGLLRGVEIAGASYQSPFTLGSSLGPDKYWGADEVRPIAYDVESETFRYSGPAYRVAG